MKELNKTPENNVIPSGVIKEARSPRSTNFILISSVCNYCRPEQCGAFRQTRFSGFRCVEALSPEPVGSSIYVNQNLFSSFCHDRSSTSCPCSVFLLCCHLQPAECYLCKESHANIIHDRGEAVCSTSSASIFNDVDCPGKEKQIRPRRRQRAVLRLPCRWQQ